MRLLAILASAVLVFVMNPFARALDVGAIESASGAKGTWIESEKVYKLTIPRDDVPVIVDGSPLPPFMGLTTSISFMGGREKQTMVMGELVLFGDEVNPAISAALEG